MREYRAMNQRGDLLKVAKELKISNKLDTLTI